MDDVRALIKEVVAQLQPAPKRRNGPKIAALLGGLLFVFVLVKFIIEWRRVPTLDQAE